MVKSEFFYRFAVKQRYVRLLMCLADGELNMREVEKACGMSRQHLYIVLSAAEKEGIIDRDRQSEGYVMRLTGKGLALQKVVEQVRVVVEHWNEDSLRVLSKFFPALPSDVEKPGISGVVKSADRSAVKPAVKPAVESLVVREGVE